MNLQLIDQQNLVRRLRQLSCLLAMLLVPAATWAQTTYDLWVAGTQVTSENAANITDEDITDGSASFDAQTNTLTLNSVTMQGSFIGGGCIISGLSSLTISVVGENTITTTDSCTAIRAYYPEEVQVAWEAKTLTIVKGEAGSSLALNTGRAIRDFSSVAITGLYWDDDYTYKQGSTGNGTGYALFNVSDAEPATATLSVAEPYGLHVGGIRVTSANADNILGEDFATAIYDNTSNTLTLRGCHYSGQTSSFISVGSDIETLTVRLAGYNQIGADTLVSSTAACTVNVTTDATMPGKLTSLGYGENMAGENVTLTCGGSLTLKEDQATISSAEAKVITYFGTGEFRYTQQTPYEGYVAWDQAGWYYADGSTTNGNAYMPPTVTSYQSESGYVTRMRTTGEVAIGSLTFQCVPLSDDIPVTVSLTSLGGDTIYATGTLVNGMVTLEPNAEVTYDVVCLTFSSESTPFSFVPMAVKTVQADAYDLWIGGEQVTASTKDNIMRDEAKSLRYDDTTNTLTMKGAELMAEGIGDCEAFIETSLPSLNVHLLGSNKIEIYTDYPVFKSTAEALAAAPTLTFTTSAGNPGKLQMSTYGSEIFGNFNPVYQNGLEYSTLTGDNEGAHLISVTPASYGLTVAGTEVTNINADNVLNDYDKSVTFDAATSTLTLSGNEYGYCQIDGDVVLAANSSIESLTVMLKHGVTMTGKFLSEKTDAVPSLFFDINPNNPGWLTFTGNTTGVIQTGFTFGEESLLNGLRQGAVNDGDDYQISTFIPITPIVNEEEVEVSMDIDSYDFTEGGSPISLGNVEVNNILYTLPADQDTFDNADGTGGVVIATGMTDEEVENAINDEIASVGSATYAEKFNGITLMVPAGIGKVSFDLKSSNGGIVKVKMGDEPAFAPEGQPFADYSTVEIPYSVAEPTYIRIYLFDDGSTPSAARLEGPRRGKVLSGTVKVKGYGASCAVAVSNNQASVYSNAGAYAEHDSSKGTMTLTAVGVGASSSSSSSRANGPRRVVEEKTFPIVELGPHAFDDLADKDNLRYLDLSGTQIKDLVVNREAGVMRGFADHTLICLPGSNDDGGESNVVVGDNCKNLSLDESYPFLAPAMTFTATKAALNRTFTAGQTSTLFLPFAIPAAQAEEMGQFHTFKEIKGANAVFNDAETGDIPANTPFIFVPKATSIEATSVSVTGIDETTATQGSLIGTYEKILWEAAQTDIYGFAAEAEGEDIAAGQFVRAGAGAYVGPFRAYLQVPAASTARLQLVIDSDNVTTGVEGNAAERFASTTWRTLDGRTLQGKPTQKGIYIYNGRKEIVK